MVLKTFVRLFFGVLGIFLLAVSTNIVLLRDAQMCVSDSNQKSKNLALLCDVANLEQEIVQQISHAFCAWR